MIPPLSALPIRLEARVGCRCTEQPHLLPVQSRRQVRKTSTTIAHDVCSRASCALLHYRRLRPADGAVDDFWLAYGRRQEGQYPRTRVEGRPRQDGDDQGRSHQDGRCHQGRPRQGCRVAVRHRLAEQGLLKLPFNPAVLLFYQTQTCLPFRLLSLSLFLNPHYSSHSPYFSPNFIFLILFSKLFPSSFSLKGTYIPEVRQRLPQPPLVAFSSDLTLLPSPFPPPLTGPHQGAVRRRAHC